MKHSLIQILKLAMLAVLCTVIFFYIDWNDSYSIVSTEGKTIAHVEGQILGPWNLDSVRFLADGNKTPEIIQPQTADNGQNTILSPGLLTYLRNLNPFPFALGAICFGLFVLVLNTRWWWLLRLNGLGVSFWEAQRFAWIGMFFNNFVPGGTGGDIVKAVYIAKHCSTNRVSALVSIIVDRILGLLSLLVVATLASFWQIDSFPEYVRWVWFVGIGALLTCVLLLSPKLRRFIHFEKCISRFPRKFSQIVSQADSAILQYRKHLPSILLWIIISPLTYSLLIASFLLMDLSLGVGLTFSDYFFIVPLVCIVQGIPIAPAGYGIGEAAYGFLIGQYGAGLYPSVLEAEQIFRTRGVALSIVHRIHITAWSLIGGILILIYRNKQK